MLTGTECAQPTRQAMASTGPAHCMTHPVVHTRPPESNPTASNPRTAPTDNSELSAPAPTRFPIPAATGLTYKYPTRSPNSPPRTRRVREKPPSSPERSRNACVSHPLHSHSSHPTWHAEARRRAVWRRVRVWRPCL